MPHLFGFVALRKNILFIYALILAFAGVSLIVLLIYHEQEPRNTTASIKSFTECLAAGYPVRESYPEVCVAYDGKTFVNPEQKLTSDQCLAYEVDDCPDTCAVCPPCHECSSISCQAKEFCATLGFNNSWYQDIQDRRDAQEKSSTQLANPASVYCEENGGSVVMREDEPGASGYCLFEDGTECEEWAFLRGECNPGN